MPCQLQPSFSQPALSRLLLALGSPGQAWMLRRFSARSNQGAISASDMPFTPCTSPQCFRVSGGVRKLEVQFTVVEPPTARPCRMVMLPSFVVRAAPSW
jgi:hypothetical protein